MGRLIVGFEVGAAFGRGVGGDVFGVGVAGDEVPVADPSAGAGDPQAGPFVVGVQGEEVAVGFSFEGLGQGEEGIFGDDEMAGRGIPDGLLDDADSGGSAGVSHGLAVSGWGSCGGIVWRCSGGTVRRRRRSGRRRRSLASSRDSRAGISAS